MSDDELELGRLLAAQILAAPPAAVAVALTAAVWSTAYRYRVTPRTVLDAEFSLAVSDDEWHAKTLPAIESVAVEVPNLRRN